MEMDGRTGSNAHEARSISRREFVRTLSAAAGSGALLTSAVAGYSLTASQKAEAAEAMVDNLGKLPKVKLSKRLGGMEISRVVWCQDNSPDLLTPALDAGMNFVHKVGYYKRRGTLPEELKKLPRESWFCDTTVDNTPRNPTDEEAAYNQVNSELEATGLKYIDIFRAHFGWHTLDAFNKGDNASYRAFLRLKKEGKVKYFGVSQHSGPREDYPTYMEMIQAQIDSGLIDHIQLWLSYATTPDELAVIEKAHNAGIGITAMKTVAHGGGKMRGDAAKMEELKAPGMMGRSCLRYVFSLKGAEGKPYVDSCVSSLHNAEVMEENLGAVATKVARADGFVIEA